MRKSTTLFHFPDINVWLALTYQRHVHHASAARWYENLQSDARLCFCRFTQLGLLRLLTTDAVMGADQALSQTQAWHAYDQWFTDGKILFFDEPASVESRFRSLSQEKRPAPKDWADSYLAAFAAEAGMCLVTFDQALEKKCGDTLLLP